MENIIFRNYLHFDDLMRNNLYNIFVKYIEKDKIM